MHVVDQIGQGLWNAFRMGWEVWWALVLGFLLSGIVQAWVPRARMERALGGAGAQQIALATGLGAASSSCSYAAIAIAKSMFQKGASFAAAIAAQTGHQHVSAGSGPKLFSVQAWSDVGHNFRGDWEMLWKEIVGGFLIAGFIALLPMSFFNGLFITDSSSAPRLLENVLLGPIVAAL